MTRARIRRARVLHVVCSACNSRSRRFVHVLAAQRARDQHGASRGHAASVRRRGLDPTPTYMVLEERFVDRDA